MNYLVMILYLLDLNSDSADTIMKLLVPPMFTLVQLMTILLPITLAIERIIIIGFPYCHRSIMTNKTVICILAVMWSLSFILTILITIIVPVHIMWPLGQVDYHSIITPFFALPRLTSAVFITAVNVFLLYIVVASNRKAKENERLGNEEKQNWKLVKLFRAHLKPTITLLLVGGIDVIGNVVISFTYSTIVNSVQPSISIYLKQFLLYPLITSLLVIHPLVYGLYMKKIRDRLPKCTACQGQRKVCKSKVTTLHQQP